MSWVRVSDVRHFSFCPRVIWHRKLVGHIPPETPKMELGSRAEAALVKLEKRRSLRRYRLDAAERSFSVRLESQTLEVGGVCDLVLRVPEATVPWTDANATAAKTPRQLFRTAPAACYPVEIKTTRGGVGRHHVLQLAGYALLLEETTGLAVDTGFVVLLPEDRVVPVSVGQSERDEFLAAVAAIRSMLESETLPAPTRFRSFCPDCEHVNFCGDVL